MTGQTYPDDISSNLISHQLDEKDAIAVGYRLSLAKTSLDVKNRFVLSCFEMAAALHPVLPFSYYRFPCSFEEARAGKV
jgi:hypothetical protein